MEENEYRVLGYDGDRVILGGAGGVAKAYHVRQFGCIPREGDTVLKQDDGIQTKFAMLDGNAKKYSTGEFHVTSVYEKTVTLRGANGYSKSYPLNRFDYMPQMGDTVEKYEYNDIILITKRKSGIYQSYMTSGKGANGEYHASTGTHTNSDANRGAYYYNTGSDLNLEYMFEGDDETYAHYGKKAKNKWTAFFMALFGGWFGLHKFYEGKIGWGILYLFTGGLFGIGAIYDCARYLFMKDNTYYVD